MGKARYGLSFAPPRITAAQFLDKSGSHGVVRRHALPHEQVSARVPLDGLWIGAQQPAPVDAPARTEHRVICSVSRVRYRRVANVSQNTFSLNVPRNGDLP